MQNLHFNLRRVAVFAGIFVMVLVMIAFNARLQDLNRLNDQRAEVRAAATQAMQTQFALQTQVAYGSSAAAVEEWARTEGHYVREGDQPVVPVGQAGSTPVVVITPTASPTPMQNWQVWWELFFGK